LKGLGLTVADIPALAPYVREDQYLLAVSFWRNFHPDRTLESSRTVFATRINDLAKHDLCRLREFEAMPEAEREKHLQRIIDWARKNAGKRESEVKPSS